MTEAARSSNFLRKSALKSLNARIKWSEFRLKTCPFCCSYLKLWRIDECGNESFSCHITSGKLGIQAWYSKESNYVFSISLTISHLNAQRSRLLSLCFSILVQKIFLLRPLLSITRRKRVNKIWVLPDWRKQYRQRTTDGRLKRLPKILGTGLLQPLVFWLWIISPCAELITILKIPLPVVIWKGYAIPSVCSTKAQMEH